MGVYYTNAILTIAASSAEDVQEPILIPRQKIDDGTRPTFSFRNKNGTSSPIVARQIPEYAGKSIIADSPLSTRGWTWQENALSTRMVHFTKTEIIWECRSQQSFENGGTLRAAIGLAYRFATARGNIEYYWKVLVSDYSKRDLSYESDRLPAISGVAAQLKSLILNAQYMAGIWRQWIFSDLLWTTSWGEETRYPPATKDLEEMPSWSWASITGQIFFQFQACEQSEDHGAIKLLDIDCEPRGINPYGPIKKYANLVLEAALFPAELIAENIFVRGSYFILVEKKRLKVLFVLPDTILLESKDVHPARDPISKSSPQARRMLSHEELDSKEGSLNASISCLYLGGGLYDHQTDRRYRSAHSTVSRHYYLILAPALGHQPHPNSYPMFTRLGLFESSDGPPRKAKKTRVMLM